MSRAWQAQFPVPDRYLTLDGARMHYIDRGQGSPLLMVHGNPTWSFHFRRLIDHFSPRYRCIAVDHVGCGWSDKPQEYPYGLQRHAENLSALIESLDLRDIHLVAHDWGGAIGLLAAVRAPHRFARVVLINTGAFPPPYIPWRIRACRLPILGPLAVRGANLFVRAAQWMAVTDRRRLTTDARAGLAAPYDSWNHRVAINRFVRDIPSSPRHPTWSVLERLESELSNWRKPVLLVWGMRDWCFRPECLDRLRRTFVHHRAIELADIGHWVLEEAPEDVIRHMEQFFSSDSVAESGTDADAEADADARRRQESICQSE